MSNESRIHTTWFMLKLTYGLVPLIAGADKFFNYLTNWLGYLSPMFANAMPISTIQFMYVIGIIEILVGLLILSPYTRLGAYIVSLWLVVLALNFASIGMYDIAGRDVVMAVGALALAQLTVICSSMHQHS